MEIGKHKIYFMFEVRYDKKNIESAISVCEGFKVINRINKLNSTHNRTIVKEGAQDGNQVNRYIYNDTYVIVFKWRMFNDEFYYDICMEYVDRIITKAIKQFPINYILSRYEPFESILLPMSEVERLCHAPIESKLEYKVDILELGRSEYSLFNIFNKNNFVI